MHELDLKKMRVELTRAGVAPKYVRRTLIELKVHYGDLKSQALKDGLSESEAVERAGSAIGDEQTILSEVLAKPELKSFIGRFPRTVFLFGPTLAVIATVLIFAITLFFIANTRAWDADSDIAMWEKLLLESLIAFNCYLVAPLLAIGTAVLAKQRIIQFHWPVLGIVLLAVLGCGWAYTLSWPTGTSGGTLQINWGYSFLPRAIRGSHDLQNYFHILTTVFLAFVVWRTYEPFRASDDELSSL